MLVKAENPHSHKYVVAKGIKVLTARLASAGYSVHNPIKKSGRGFWLNSILRDPLVATSMRLSCSDVGKEAGTAEKG